VSVLGFVKPGVSRYLGRPRIAVCSRPFRGREAYPYYDLDFWADPGRSIWRPQWTLDELEREPSFTYRSRCLVERFQEHADGVRVEVTLADSGTREVHEARSLVLAGGIFSRASRACRALGRGAGTRSDSTIRSRCC
jgi:hypothetical protein